MNALAPSEAPTADAIHGLVHVALPRRVVLQDRGGVPTIYWGDQVLSFDTADLAPLARMIADGRQFVPALACPHAKRETLTDAVQALQDIGILSNTAQEPAPRQIVAPNLPQGHVTADWRQAGDVAQALGLAIHPAHLELVVPVFRIAHPVLDADHRQVGEANVFPRALRQAQPTEWQTCTYAGTRHRDDKPMNVTALKAMRAHWPEMMAVLAEIRRRYMARAGIAGPMTLGQIERLCIAVLSLPTWEAFAEGPLDPVLSSLFRVTDGLRIVVHQMMFVPTAEPMLPPETRVTAAELFDYAERSLSFHSDTGVCAGPQHFIAEFLAVLVEGAEPRFGAGGRVGPAMAAALSRLDPAMDYGFAALAAHAASFAVWPVMAEAWAEIAALAERQPSGASAQLDAFRAEAAEAERRLFQASYLGQAEWRRMRLATYGDMERNAARLARLDLRPAALTTVCPDALELAQVLPGLTEPAALAAILARFALDAGALLARASAVQAWISAGLGRPAAPGFALSDMVWHGRLVADPHPRLQFLPEALQRLTGLELTIQTMPGHLPDPQIDPKSMNRANRA